MGTFEKACFEKNRTLLKKNHLAAWEKISGAQDVPEQAELVFSDNGKPNLKVKLSQNKSISIHDMDDPGRESKSFLSTVGETSTGVVLVLGMGLGYSALEIARRLKKVQHIIVFELNVEFFIQALNNMDLSDLLEDKRVILSLGKPDNLADILEPANWALMLENIHTLKLISCFEVNKSYEQLSVSVFEYVSRYNLDGVTAIIHGKSFFENRIKHLTSMHHDNLLEDMAEKFKKVPALIIAAGPSLDKNINQIHRAVGRSVIFAVDTVLPSLLKHGIKPDFVTSIDYQELTYEKMAGVASDPLCREINLICTSSVTPVIPKNLPVRNVFWAFLNSAFDKWISGSLGGKMTSTGAGTVAHLNLISAKTMGCDPVIFVGQDLAFSDNRDHSSNVVLTNKESMETMIRDEQDILWVKGVNGSDVTTTRAFLSYKVIFEKMIESSEGIFINSTEGGAEIKGAESMPLADAIDRFCSAPVVWDVNCDQRNFKLDQALTFTLNTIKKIENTINKADRLAGYILKEVERLKDHRECLTSLSKLPVKMQKKIIELDACHNKADTSQLWSIFNDMTLEGIRENEREKNEIQTLENIPEKYLDWLSKSVVRTDMVNKLRIKNSDRFKKQLNELIAYHNKEKSLLDRMERNNVELSNVLELARIYYQTNDFVLLEKLLERQGAGYEKSAEITYYWGVIALHRGEYRDADHRFQLAIEYDAAYEKKIFDKRYGMADYYLEAAVSEKRSFGSGGYSNVVRYLLVKGLKCYSDHGKLKKELQQAAENNLQRIRMNMEARDEGKSEESRALLENWIGIVDKEKEARNCLEKGVVVQFYKLYGNILSEEKEYRKALDHYRKALAVLPETPDLYLCVANTCLSLGDFDSGVKFLKIAVDLDKGYGVYWNNMGDNLQLQEDYNGAIMAYEHYFLALPDQIEALKKIGDCYAKLGNVDVASEAYQQFERMVKKK